MKFDFVKMHGAGNDFIMIDDRSLTFPWEDYQRMAAIAARRTGIGCEGIVLVQPSSKADFFMRFLNPDGTEAELCGNGARCVALFAHILGIGGKSMTFDTKSGLIDAELAEDGVWLWMPEPTNRRYDLSVNVCGRDYVGHALSIGCPHFVVPLSPEELEGIDVQTVGLAIRQHEAFAPNGTNVDFMSLFPRNRIRLRTYERGVEAESGACGTGAVSSAVIAVECLGCTLPVKVSTTSSYELSVDGDWRTGKCTGLTLKGPAQEVYSGTIDLDAFPVEADM